MPAATGVLLSLSKVTAWDTEHLQAAAAHWDRNASSWESAFTEVYQQMPNPGGAPWSGAAADAAHLRAHSDRAKVLTAVDDLHSAAATARSGAAELSAAKQRVLATVNAVRTAGFVVGEDFSVMYPFAGSPAEAAARRLQAESYSTQIRGRAAALVALDHEVASRITAAAMGVGEVNFKEAPPGADALGVRNAKDVHKIVDPLPPGKRRNVKTLPTPDAIRGLYEQLTENAGPAPPTSYPGDRRVLEDGTVIGYRPTSVWGGPTVEIEYPDGTETDVHLPERPTPTPIPETVPAPDPGHAPTIAPGLRAPDFSPGPNLESPPALSDEQKGILATIGAVGIGIIAGVGTLIEGALGQ